MKIVKPEAYEMYSSSPMKHIEAIGRICYKSEDKITETSAAPFIGRLFKSGHGAMLEHYIFIVQMPMVFFRPLAIAGYPHMECTMSADKMDETRNVVSMSARTLTDMLIAHDDGQFNDKLNLAHITREELTISLLATIKHIVYHYGCDELFGDTMSPCEQSTFKILNQEDLIGQREISRHGWHSVFFRHDRGFTHELVRMRMASFGQESTRYCNYNNAEHIEFIRPFKFAKDTMSYVAWRLAMCCIESVYKILTGDHKEAPQWARGVLPQSVKADIVMTTRNWHWQHILNLRYTGTTGAPHPQMREAMELLVDNADWARQMVSADGVH